MASAPLEPLTVAPKKTGITVQLVALTWVPFWDDERGGQRRFRGQGVHRSGLTAQASLGSGRGGSGSWLSA